MSDLVVESIARDGRGARLHCPMPHFDRDGNPITGPAAFRFYNATTGKAAVACRGHAPVWAAPLPDHAPRRRSK